MSQWAEPDGIHLGLLVHKLETLLQDLQTVAKVLADKVLGLLIRHRLLAEQLQQRELGRHSPAKQIPAGKRKKENIAHDDHLRMYDFFFLSSSLLYYLLLHSME